MCQPTPRTQHPLETRPACRIFGRDSVWEEINRSEGVGHQELQPHCQPRGGMYRLQERHSWYD